MKRPAAKCPIDATVMRRLDSLERLIDAEYGGNASTFEARTGIKMAQVNQWFTGYRALRDKALKRLAMQTGKDEKWFDTASGALTEQANAQDGSAPPSTQPGNVARIGAPTLRQALDVLGEAIKASPNRSSASLQSLLADYAKDPDNKTFAELLIGLLEPDKANGGTAQVPPVESYRSG